MNQMDKTNIKVEKAELKMFCFNSRYNYRDNIFNHKKIKR